MCGGYRLWKSGFKLKKFEALENYLGITFDKKIIEATPEKVVEQYIKKNIKKEPKK